MKKILFILFFLPVFVQAQIITTFAGGNDSAGYSGDGVPATVALLNYPECARPDNAGNVYIADVANNYIRKVNSAGIITTIAGNGTNSYNGDGGLAIEAGLIQPRCVAVDSIGNLYIGENGDVYHLSGSWIRKVDTSGIITTVAGSNTFGYSGDGGQATEAEFRSISDVVVDGAGNIYIVDYGNNCIREIKTTGIITTIAGNGTKGYIGDGGPATIAELNAPMSMGVDGAGNIYIADDGNRRVRKVNTAGIITTIAGSGSIDTFAESGDGGPATSAKLGDPRGIAVDGYGNIYVTDDGRVRKIDALGVINTIAGNGHSGYSGDGEQATDATLYLPTGVSVDGVGNIYIADPFINNVIRKIFSPTTGITTPILSKTDLVIYPNPTTNLLSITSTDKITNVTIANLIGQTVYRNNYHTEEVQIDASALPEGIYLLRINGTEVRKFVKR